MNITVKEPIADLQDLVPTQTEAKFYHELCKRKICDGHYTPTVRVLSSFGVAPDNDATLEDLKSKCPFKPAPSLPNITINHHYLIASPAVVLDRIKSFPRGTSYRWDGLRAQHLLDCLSGDAIVTCDELVSSITQVVYLFLDGKCPKILGEYIASAPLTPLVKPGGGIRSIAVGTIWRRLIRDSFILCLYDWYLDDGTIVGDTLVKGEVLEFKIEDEPRRGLHFNVDKTKIFWPKEDPRSMIEGVFPPNIARPLHGVKLSGGLASVDFDFSCEFVMKRLAKAIGLMDAVAKINDPQCELMLLRACTGISDCKEVDIGIDGGHDKPRRLEDMLLYSWDGGLDVCVNLTGSSPLTQTGLAVFVPGRAVSDALHRKHVKYCADIGYDFLLFSFSLFGKLEKDAVALLKRI
nr:hypothetical protein [Tanacetum cinerariifolium]